MFRIRTNSLTRCSFIFFQILKEFPEELRGDVSMHLHREILQLPIFESASQVSWTIWILFANNSVRSARLVNQSIQSISLAAHFICESCRVPLELRCCWLCIQSNRHLFSPQHIQWILWIKKCVRTEKCMFFASPFCKSRSCISRCIASHSAQLNRWHTSIFINKLQLPLRWRQRKQLSIYNSNSNVAANLETQTPFHIFSAIFRASVAVCV